MCKILAAWGNVSFKPVAFSRLVVVASIKWKSLDRIFDFSITEYVLSVSPKWEAFYTKNLLVLKMNWAPKIPKLWGSESFQVDEHIHVLGDWYTPTHRTEAPCPGRCRPHTASLFIWLVIHVLYHTLYKLANVSVFLSSENCSCKLIESWWGEYGNVRFIAEKCEAQVTICTCDWHLKWLGEVLGDWTLYLWDLTLSPVSVRIESNWVKS